MNYQKLYQEGCGILEAAGVEEAKLDARLLLEAVCGTTYNDLLVHGDRLPDSEQAARYRECIGQRAEHIPLQHITGTQEFMGLSFRVNEKVLIPRQDTEILVEEVLRELHDGMRILDLCTGSGCILISLLRYSNDCEGVGVDISKEALQVACENARLILGRELSEGENGGQFCGCGITFLESDLFSKVEGKFDRIVSNPPYIRSEVIQTLMPEVREHEPLLALDGKEDGLFFYRRIVDESRSFLCGGGSLYLEIGCDQAKEVRTLMEEAGFAGIHVVKDYAGLDRVVYGTL